MNLRRFFLLQRLSLTAGIVVGICTTTLLLTSCGQQEIPLIEQKCGTCHSASRVYQTRRTEEGWRQVMHGMKIRGMEITEEEEKRVYEILFRDYLLK